MGRFTGLLGLAAILSVAVAFSKHRRAIRPGTVLWGLGLQFLFAFLVLKTAFGRVFDAASAGVNALMLATQHAQPCLARAETALAPLLLGTGANAGTTTSASGWSADASAWTGLSWRAP